MYFIRWLSSSRLIFSLTGYFSFFTMPVHYEFIV
jgi:hypothetical protein